MTSVNNVNSGRWMVLAFASVVLLTGFILGRSSAPDPVASAETKAPGAAATASPVAGSPGADYSESVPAGTRTEVAFDPRIPNDFRSGYSEGFRQGFTEGIKTETPGSVSQPRTTNTVRRVYYQPAARPVFYERKKNSTLKTVLTIAAPAAIGAGVGAAVAGGKGAGAGALIGGGGGALYHLFRNH